MIEAIMVARSKGKKQRHEGKGKKQRQEAKVRNKGNRLGPPDHPRQKNMTMENG